ncbi:MAG: hypothetical protein AB8I69_05660, partial [Anaerolineae bacterium]
VTAEPVAEEAAAETDVEAVVAEVAAIVNEMDEEEVQASETAAGEEAEADEPAVEESPVLEEETSTEAEVIVEEAAAEVGEEI